MKKMIVAATAPLICSTIRSASARKSRAVATIQNRKSMTKAVNRSPLLATSTSRTMPSGVMISRRLRDTPSRKRLIRSSLCAIAGAFSVREKIAAQDHAGGQADGETRRSVADQLPEPAFNDAGDEKHQHRPPGQG